MKLKEYIKQYCNDKVMDYFNLESRIESLMDAQELDPRTVPNGLIEKLVERRNHMLEEEV